ncbi:jg6308, partial [Pararge aegeria aegeria]
VDSVASGASIASDDESTYSDDHIDDRVDDPADDADVSNY